MISLSTLALTVTDAGGGNAGISVQNVDTAIMAGPVEVYFSPATTAAGPRAWALLTTINPTLSTVTDTVPVDYTRYVFLAVQLDSNGDAQVSNEYFRVIADGSTSVWERCVIATRDAVRDLNLTGLPDASVNYTWLPKVRPTITQYNPPCCQIAPFGRESQLGGLTGTDDVGYPVIVIFFDKTDNQSLANFSRDLVWRWLTQRLLRYQRLTGVSEIFNTEVSPDVVVNPEALEKGGLWASAMVFTFVSREPRGVT